MPPLPPGCRAPPRESCLRGADMGRRSCSLDFALTAWRQSAADPVRGVVISAGVGTKPTRFAGTVAEAAAETPALQYPDMPVLLAAGDTEN